MDELVFLVGPPGCGKSTLGRKACAELGLCFVDLVDDGGAEAALDGLLESKDADVVALPWAPTRDTPRLRRCRRAGQTVALWAHPLDMQGRSGRTEPLFTPVQRLSTRGGFGRNGTGCREYRHLARACEHVLLLVGLDESDAARELKALIEDLRAEKELSPAEREGLLGWAKYWSGHLHGDKKACDLLVDSMARFAMHLKAQGASPRKMSGIYDDLNSAGLLLVYCEAPKGKNVLKAFESSPPEYEFRRKISESPRAMARFRSTWEAFGAFLRDSGLVGGGGEQE